MLYELARCAGCRRVHLRTAMINCVVLDPKRPMREAGSDSKWKVKQVGRGSAESERMVKKRRG